MSFKKENHTVLPAAKPVAKNVTHKDNEDSSAIDSFIAEHDKLVTECTKGMEQKPCD
jgi:hypothetical protein